jgi:hypothetical protein
VAVVIVKDQADALLLPTAGRRRAAGACRSHPRANRWVGQSLVTLASCDPTTRESDDPLLD